MYVLNKKTHQYNPISIKVWFQFKNSAYIMSPLDCRGFMTFFLMEVQGAPAAAVKP